MGTYCEMATNTESRVVSGTRFANHDSLYLPDGNVILLAPSSIPHSFAVFRVHQSLLSRHSSVIKELLLDRDVKLEEHDGVPSIHMSNSAEEIEYLLKYIYGDLTLPLRRLMPENLTAIQHLLKLSSKYTIPTIRRQLIPRLEQDWPPTLFHWDSLELEISGLLSVWNDDPVPSYFDDYLPEPASAIRLAVECNIPSILPAAFYHLSRLNIFQDRSIKARDDDHDPENVARSKLQLRMAKWDQLQPRDFVSLLKGQHRLAHAAEEMMFDEPRLFSLSKYHCFGDSGGGGGGGDGGGGGGGGGGCSVDDQWAFWKEVKDAWKYSKDVLGFLNDRVNKVQSRTEICESCRLDIQKALKHMRQEIWSKLPLYFDLARS